ncbi:MAG: thioredoxin family protein [Bacteroidales bacterium]|nr:thioredoxin family protein [Bacteroidales bacterium]
MKKQLVLMFVSLWCSALWAQSALYSESADAMQQITQAVQTAAQSNKYVLCQVGGNWCPWCVRFAYFTQSDTAIRQILEDNYVYIHVNYSKNNKNPQAMQYLGNPARFGFPVLVILDERGQVIHIQNSAYLEEGNSYNAQKVKEFLSQWTPQAVKTLK